MAKGFFSQGVCLLTDGRTSIDEVNRVLLEAGYEVVKANPAHENLAFSGPSVVISFMPQINGYVSIDVVSQVWPDAMGDPKSDPITFGAWSMGHFGPFAYPGSLARAQQHAWAWPQGRTLASTHAGFIRLRASYVFGAGDNAPVLPKHYDAIGELIFLSQLSLALLPTPGVICYFNPNGEVLRDRSGFREVLTACAEHDKPPLPLWVNIRFFDLNEKLGLMDTVGNAQMDVWDLEAIFPKSKYEPADVDYYLRNVTHYLLDADPEIRSGEVIDAPGENNLSWVIEMRENGLLQPPRRVLQLFPRENRDELDAAIAAAISSPA